MSTESEPPAINTTVAHPARVYDYWLGGKGNFPADRDAAEQAAAAYPNILPGVQANRAGPADHAHRAEILGYFDGLDLVDPGLVSLPY